TLLARLRLRTRTEDAFFEARCSVLDWVLGQRYQAACLTPSDINEHLPVLYELAKDCDHITELGTRTGISTLALLCAQPHKWVGPDLARFPEGDQLKALGGRTELAFQKADGLQAALEEPALLFLAAPPAPDQRAEGLRRHACCARQFVVLYGTAPCAGNGT